MRYILVATAEPLNIFLIFRFIGIYNKFCSGKPINSFKFMVTNGSYV